MYYLLYCPNYLDERRILLDYLQSTRENIHDKNDSPISELLLFGVVSNTCILNATMEYCPIHIGY